MQNYYKFILASEPYEIENLTKYLKKSFSEIKVSEDFFNHCLLILTEAINNAIIHGNKNNKDKKVILEVNILEDKIEFIITDEGEGFADEKVPDPTLPENIFLDHGRGLFIMKHYTEQLYFKKSKKGNSLFLILKLNKE